MQILSIARPAFRHVGMSVAAGALLLHAGASSAGCASAMLDSVALASSATPATEFGKSSSRPADASASGFVHVSSEQRFAGGERAIVGLWKFEMISKNVPGHMNPMPDGVLVDFGTAAWHGDGTEFQSSGFHNPADGAVCQGVWKQLDESTFVLNHYALAWQGGVYAGPAHIRAEVSLNPKGTRYTGQFVTTVYAATATIGHEFDETTPLVTITGTFTATRVTVAE